MKKGYFNYGDAYGHGIDAEYENFLVGDREGLIYFRDQIDELLGEKEAVVLFDDQLLQTEISGLALVDNVESYEEEPMSLSARMTISSIFFGFGAVLLCGVWKIAELIF